MDPAALDRPRIALSGAGREALRLAETIEQMLRESLRPFREDAPQLREEIRRRDAEADRACAAILAYLTALARRPLAPGDEREVFDLILFTTNLEHVGDIIDKNLMALAEKRQRLGVTFSDEGWDELERMHALALEQFRLSAAVFVTRDRRLARDLVRLKDRVRALEREATAGHLRRLREGEAEPESSALHLDMLRDYKRIVAHATAVATPILEAAGELRGTRLAPRPRAEPEPAA